MVSTFTAVGWVQSLVGELRFHKLSEKRKKRERERERERNQGKKQNTKTCTWIFTTALFTTATTCKQPRYPSVGKWINKLWYIQMKEYYSLLKRTEVPSHRKT